MGLILIDTSIWIDHLHRPDTRLSALLGACRGLMHPLVLAEIAVGNIALWDQRLGQLLRLPMAEQMPVNGLLDVIAQLELQGTGLGATDVHLLATTLATSDCRLWTRDKRLAKQAEKAGVGWSPDAD